MSINTRQMIKLDGSPALLLSKIPAVIKPSLKRPAPEPSKDQIKIPRYSMQLGDAINSLPPTTIIKATSRTATNYHHQQQQQQQQQQPSTPTDTIHNKLSPSALPASRPATIYIRREMPKRTMRSMFLEMIDSNPSLHLGITSDRLPILKQSICKYAGLSHLNCCIALKKLRLNESFAVLAEYFEYTETEVEQIFIRTIAKLSSVLRHLIRWPDNKHYYERYKYMPFAYRSKLSQVQSLIECVETDVNSSMNIGFTSYKFIYCINTSGIISYISEAYRGDCDDLMLFEAVNFKSIIPKYLTLVSEAGKSIKRQSSKPKDIINESEVTDEEIANTKELTPELSRYEAQRVAGEIASTQTLSIQDGKLTSSCAKHMSIPTVQLRTSICREQVRASIDTLREFRILQPSALYEPVILEYLNEILIVAAALTNLQR